MLPFIALRQRSSRGGASIAIRLSTLRIAHRGRQPTNDPRALRYGEIRLAVAPIDNVLQCDFGHFRLPFGVFLSSK